MPALNATLPSNWLSRARRAGDAVQAAGGSAMDAALASISAGFDRAAEIESFKNRVRYVVGLGAGHDAIRWRYGERLVQLRSQVQGLRADVALDRAIALVEHWYRIERRAFAISSALGRGNRLGIERLRELRLMLRVLRRSPYRNHLAGIVSFFLSSHDYLQMQDDIATAAE